MINGIKPSQMELRNTSISIHYSRLSNIVQSPYKSISSFNKNFINIVNRKKFNHTKWKIFHSNQSISKIQRQNQQKKQKLIKISNSKPKLINQSFSNTYYNKSNYFYQRKRFQTSIDKQNPQIAKRILKATGIMNHKKDFQSYKKTRQIVKRLQNFPVIKRLQNNIGSNRRRYKTQQKIQHSPLKAPKSLRSLYFLNQNSPTRF